MLLAAGDQFLAVTRWARTQALADSQVYRLNVDNKNGTYFVTVQDGQQFIPPGTEFGRVFAVPDGFAITMTDNQGQQPLNSVDFLPTGRGLFSFTTTEQAQAALRDIEDDPLAHAAAARKIAAENFDGARVLDRFLSDAGVT